MSWWDDFVDAAADVVETAVNAVGDTVADVVETTGNAVQDLANAVGDVLSGIPWVGGFLEGTSDWLGGIVAGATNFVGAVIKGVLGIVGGVVAGLIRIIGGIVGFNGDLILKGLIDIGSSIAGAVLIILGTLASLVQRIIFCQNNDRPLTEKEREMLRKVFHLSISLYNIRIIEGWSGIFGITTSGAFVLGNTIYSNATDFSASPQILVHECVHVWQYQVKGARYTMDALGAQAIYGPTDTGGGAYDWEAELDRGRSDWGDFNKEAQSEFMEDVWLLGTMQPLHPGMTGGNGTFFLAGSDVFVTSTGKFEFGGTDHSDLAIAATETLRGGFNIRMSKFLYM